MVGKEDTPHKHRTDRLPTGEPTTAPKSETKSVQCHFSFTEDREMTECFMHLPEEECYLNLPPDSAIDNPLDMDAIKEQQDANNELQNQAMKHAESYICKSISAVDDVLCYVKPGDFLE
jgi:hypothetical protein